MLASNSMEPALRILHYLTPLLILGSLVGSRLVAACFLHRPSKNARDTTRRNVVIFLLCGAIATVIAQAVVYVLQFTSEREAGPSQHAVVFFAGSAFAYTYALLVLLDLTNPIWWPFGLFCLVAAILETSISVLDALRLRNGDNWAFARLALQVTRCLLLVAICLSEGWHTLHYRSQKLHDDDETEPLVSSNTNGALAKADYGSVPANRDSDDDSIAEDMDSDEDEPEEYLKLKQQQRQRLQESGSWFNYLKEFKIFVPMLWPTKNRFIQSCLLVIGSVMVAERFLNVLVPRQLGIIIDKITAGNGNGMVPWTEIGVWIALSYLNSGAGIYVFQQLAELPVEQFAYKRIGAESFKHIMHLDMSFHTEKNSGELIRAIDQGQNLQGLLEFAVFRVPPIFVDLSIAVIYVYTLFKDMYMSMILVVVGCAYVWAGAKTTAWSVKRRRNFNTAMRNESKVQQEAISNWSTVSHFNRGNYECDRYGKSIDDFNSAEMSYFFAFYLGGSLQSLIMVVGRIAATTLGIYRVTQGVVPVGNLVALITYWRSIENPLQDMSWSIRRLTQMLTDSERLLQLFQTKPLVQDDENATAIKITKGLVEFEEVDFAYDARRPTLSNISFKALPGQTVALVGETGGGKSTIIKLLYRYYDVAGGAIRIDGQDIRSVTLDSLRDSFGMVPQDPALFNISIMENLRYARLDARDNEVKEACKAAAIHDKIEKFPNGYESTVGERGVKLSGGELQRVAIARAILRQPKIVLLDEATSMIDAETESTIQEAFKNLSASRTTFVIAHRLSTIQHADLILVIQDGEIVERGTHDELFKDSSSKYVKLWSKQLSKEVQLIGDSLRDNNRNETSLDGDGIGESAKDTEEP